MATPLYTSVDYIIIKKLYGKKTNIFNQLFFAESSLEEDTLRSLNLCLSLYTSSKKAFAINAPTEIQLKQRMNRLSSALLKVKTLCEENFHNQEDLHFILALVSAQNNGENIEDIDDDIYTNNIREIQKNTIHIHKNVSKLNDTITLCVNEGFQYPHSRKTSCKTTPETTLIRNLSKSLTNAFSKGGFWRNNHDNVNSASGWRIDCLEHLLQKISVNKTRNQILDAIASGDKKK